MPANVIKIITETEKNLSLQSRETPLFPNAVRPSWLHHAFAFSTHWLVWGLGGKLGILIAWQQHRQILETVNSALNTKAEPTDTGKECEIMYRKWKKVGNWEIAVMLMDYDSQCKKNVHAFNGSILDLTYVPKLFFWNSLAGKMISTCELFT